MVDLPTFGEFFLGGANSSSFYCSPRKIGEDEAILTNIQMGWNHQLDIEKH